MTVFHPADAVYNELIMETGSQMDFVSSHKVRQKEGEESGNREDKLLSVETEPLRLNKMLHKN